MSNNIKTVPFEFFKDKIFELTGINQDNNVIDYIGHNRSAYGYSNVINFVLDCITYTAIEDPDDGYRSSLDYITASDFEVDNRFSPVKVKCSYKSIDKSFWSDESNLNVSLLQAVDKILFYDIDTNKLILEVGTDNTDDYYPCFVGDFYIENLPQNAGLSNV